MSTQSNITQALLFALDHHRAGRIAVATSIYRKILQADPRQADALHLLGMSMHQQGDHQQAEELIGRAIEINPDYADYHNNLGNVRHHRGHVDEAIDSFRQAIRLRPDYASAMHNLANVLRETGAMEEAVSYLQRALTIDPEFTQALSNLAIALQELGKFEEAAENARRALEICPTFADAHNNLGVALLSLGETGRAEDCFVRALQLRSDTIQPRINLAKVSQTRGRLEEAVAHLDRAIELHPLSPDARLNRALLLLQSGQWKQGWESYHWRLKSKSTTTRDFHLPRWNGEDLRGKTILLVDEQGLGDSVMFASCLNDVIQRASRCIVETKPRLVPILKRSFPTATILAKPVDPQSDAMLGVDLVSLIGCLPRILRTSNEQFPLRPGYLAADAVERDVWRRRFEQLGVGPKIGISWRGGTKPKVRRTRSTTLDQWQPILSVAGVHFVNLQYGESAEELAAAKSLIGIEIHDFDDVDPLEDLDRWAAQVAALDLVISVDNSTVHVAGALGVPVWTLLPKVANWRWMHDRDDSPWYPGMRLFRQIRTADWTAPIQRVARGLELWRSRIAGEPHAGAAAPPAPRTSTQGRIFQSPWHQDTQSNV